jgi:myb proto-oncogene protein
MQHPTFSCTVAADHLQLDAIIGVHQQNSLTLPVPAGGDQDSPPGMSHHCPLFMFDTSISPPFASPAAQQHSFIASFTAAMAEADAPGCYHLPPLVDGMGAMAMDMGMDAIEDHCGSGVMGNGCYGDEQKQQRRRPELEEDEREQLGQHDQWDEEQLLMWDDQEVLTPSNMEAIQSGAHHSLLFMGPNA